MNQRYLILLEHFYGRLLVKPEKRIYNPSSPKNSLKFITEIIDIIQFFWLKEEMSHITEIIDRFFFTIREVTYFDSIFHYKDK